MVVQVVIKERDILADGRVNIYLSLRQAGQKPSLKATGKRIFPSQWDREARQVKASVPNAVLLNNFLREQIQTLEGIILDQQRRGLALGGIVPVGHDPPWTRRRPGPLTYKSVWNQYTGQTDGTPVVAFIEQSIAHLKAQVAPKTYQDYQGGLSRILSYQPHVRFEDISESWLRSYEAFQRQKGRKPNGIFRDMSVLRKFFNLAREDGLIKNYPFSAYQLPKEETIREFLMPAELTALDTFFFEHGDTLPEGAHKTLGFYLFSCYTGLSHDDLLKRLDWQWLDEKLIIRRGKTKRKGKLTTIPLISRAKRLVPHVQQHTIKQKKARIGEDLRLIAHRSGITKHLTYHTARHTFAINSLMLGVNIKVIQSILGHSTVRTTEVYLRIVDEYVDQEMAKWED